MRNGPVIELVLALVVLLVVVAVARPSTPAPLSAQAAWAWRTTPAINRLTLDVAGAGRALDPGAGASASVVRLPAGTVDRLRIDAAGVRTEGPPPDRVLNRAWAQALDQVQIALALQSTAPAAARAALALAGLDLERLSSGG